MERKKKLRIIQLSLFFVGIVLLLTVYTNKEKDKNLEIIPKKKQEEVNKDPNISNDQTGDIFYNIEYSGFDLSGNRYILKAKEALNDKNNQNYIEMKNVEAFFYFKDSTILKVFSENGIYNNKTFDMLFTKNVKAFYNESKLLSQRAEYSNSKNFLQISDKVKVEDSRGNFTAEKLYFDINDQTLNIGSSENSKVNANINLK
tara:strand:+ start:61 stop:666 length:606 start_codon:yes stop_codon:yes gene_type:complete